MSGQGRDVFDEIVGGLEDLAGIDVDAVAGPQTPAMDQLLDWGIVDGRIVFRRAAPVVAVLGSIVLNAPWGAPDPSALLQVPEGDLRAEAISARAADLATESERCVAAAKDFLTGNLPVSGCFDAARGLQHVRLRLLDGPGGDSEDVEQLALLAAVFAEELLEFALA